MTEAAKTQSAWERRRVDVAIMTILVLGILPVTFAAVSDCGRTGKETGEFLDVVSGEDVMIPSGLGDVLFPLDDFEVIGLSDDSSVVGFISILPTETVCMEVDRGMKNAGWKALPSQGEGIISYSRVPSPGDGDSEYSYALVVINEVEKGTSIVVRLM